MSLNSQRKFLLSKPNVLRRKNDIQKEKIIPIIISHINCLIYYPSLNDLKSGRIIYVTWSMPKPRYQENTTVFNADIIILFCFDLLHL